jgi:hypothetical protein
MTPKEKAEELIVKMSIHDRDVHPHFTHYIAKQCALIAVDEILGLWIQLFHTLKQETIISGKVELSAIYIYWQEVKQEIDKL